MSTIKKTMVACLAYVTALEGKNGKSLLSEDQIKTFTDDFCIAKSGNASDGPRELTILRDGSDVATAAILGRKCTLTHKFFPIDRFSKNTSCIKEADAVKLKRYNESKKMEADAKVLLVEARDITDIQEKVAKFTEYDKALLAATESRKGDIEVDAKWMEGSFDTIEDLAKSLNVEVIKPIAPVKEKAETEA